VLVLALDTSTDAVVVGLVEIPAGPDGAGPRTTDPEGGSGRVTVLAEQVCPGARQHSEQLMPALLAVCASAGRRPVELDAVVCGVGPGPFTGLRVGIASAAAFADALGVPAHGVCSLDGVAAGPAGSAGLAGLAGGIGGGQPLLVVTDARRREVYWAAYLGARRTHGPGVDTPAVLAERVPDLGVRLIAGTMAEELAESFGLAVHPARRPCAEGLVVAATPLLLTGGEPAPLEPMYLRRPDAVPPGARKRVTAGMTGTT
jgi:tRNA threonylcarbamoyl adenosine modification protein YeaZ